MCLPLWYGFPIIPLNQSQSSTEKYDENTTRQCLNFAQAAYCDVTPNAFKCKTCDTHDVMLYSVITHDSVKVIVGYSTDQKAVMVGIRGSSNIMNWVYDLKFTKVHPYKEMPDVAVEEGFYELHQNLLPDVTHAINQVSQKHMTTRVITTGHSLGGSLSTLLTFDLANGGLFDVHNINFGSPRVGNKAFSDTFSLLMQKRKISVSFRVVHNNDIIPHMPLKWLMGFHHIPTEVWYNADSTHHQICNNSGEDNECSNSLLVYSPQAHLTYMNVSMGLMGC